MLVGHSKPLSVDFILVTQNNLYIMFTSEELGEGIAGMVCLFPGVWGLS